MIAADAISAPLIVKRPARTGLADLVAKSLELPTVPAIAAEVTCALDDPDLTAGHIAKIIETDQGITARLIKTSNSALYGFSRKVTSPQLAVTLLGFMEVRNIIVASSTRYLYKRFGSAEKVMWQHSVSMAVATRMLASALAPSAKYTAYLAGQMHDVGRVVMNNADPKRFLETELATPQVGSCQAELSAFGFTHTDVGSLLAAQWKMPPAVEAACFYHHDLAMGRSIAPEHSALVACVVLADGMCQRLGLGTVEAPASCEPDEQDALEVLGITDERLKALTAEFDQNFRSEISL
jgi:HD-like signal output (HDOD) protein